VSPDAAVPVRITCSSATSTAKTEYTFVLAQMALILKPA
jgi:hypothetical protein